MRFLFLAGLLSLSAHAADPLVNTDFGVTPEPVRSAKPDRITGVLPRGVIEDSAWADVTVRYSPQADRLGSDLKWIRAEVGPIDRGRAQLKWPLPGAVKGGLFRLETTLSSDTGCRLTLRVTEQEQPYKVLWEQTIVPTPGRETKTFDFQLPPSAKPPALLLMADRPGVFDLYSVVLSMRTPGDVAAERAAAIAAAPANLAPNAGFALGLPTGWGTGRRLSSKLDARFLPADAASPGGTTPLVIELLREGVKPVLLSAPFSVPDPSQLYIVSFVAGGGPASGTVTVFSDGKECGSGPFVASAEGTLVKIPFRPDSAAKWQVIRWEFDGPATLDALNVSMGRQAKPFALPGAAEVALAAAPDHGNIFVEGVDAPSVRYAITGSAENATLRTRTTDLYGGTAEAAPMALTPETLRGSITPAAPDASRPLGSFRFEAWVEQEGKPASPVAEVVYHVVPKPVFWGRVAPESKFGNHFHTYEPHMYAAKAIGSNWNRIHGGNGDTAYWSAVEPVKGEWKWHKERLSLYRDANLAVCGVWLHAPGWARVTRADAKGWLDNWWQPRDYAEFAEYARRSAVEYKGLVNAWQIWNEPWGEFWFKEWRDDLQGTKRWHHGPTPAEDFVALSKAAWEAAHPVIPETPILGIDGTLGERGKKWMSKLLELGAENYCNAISFHAYFGGDLDQILSPKSEILANLESRIFAPIRNNPAAAAQPLWMTEGGWLQRKADTGLYKNSVPGPKDPLDAVREGCVKLPLYHAVLFSLGVEKVFCYAMNGGPEFYRPYPQGQIDWSSLVTPSGEMHPAASAYAAMAQRLDTATFDRRIPAGDGTLAFVFRTSQGGELVLLFGQDLNSRLGSLTAHSADFLGNPPKPDIVHQLLYVSVPEGQTAEQLLAPPDQQ